MNTYEINLNFEASFMVTASNLEEAIAEVIERARDKYGSEIADYGTFKEEVPDQVSPYQRSKGPRVNAFLGGFLLPAARGKMFVLACPPLPPRLYLFGVIYWTKEREMSNPESSLIVR